MNCVLYYSYILKITVLIVILFLFNISLKAQVAWGDPQAIPVEFMFYHTLTPKDSGVGLNGAFNSWTGGVYKMNEVSPGFWKTKLELLPLGYEYKFVTYTDTVGQSGVIQYYPDPLNPKNTGGGYNNSIITVKSPMIYYLLPKTGTTVPEQKPEITAHISWANEDQIDLTLLVFKIDGNIITNPQNYFDENTRILTYNPSNALSIGDHSVEVRAFTTNGDSAVLSSTFKISGTTAYQGPYTFMFDSHSPNFKFIGDVNSVIIKSPFNHEGADQLTDPDSDGIYTFTTNLDFDQTYEYTYVINGGSYINDPDNPILSTNHRTEVTKQKQTNPYFSDVTPKSGQLYNDSTSVVAVKATLNQSDDRTVLDLSSVKATLDGASNGISKTYLSNKISILVNISNPSIGRHVVQISGKDIFGHIAKPVILTFGVYSSNSGFHYVDGEQDDHGPGTYYYPSGIDSGSADIQSIDIKSVPTGDSLRFSIKMNKISDNTRIGFGIVNLLDNTFVDAPENLNLQIPEWNNKGVFMLLASPTSSYLDTSKDNILYTSRDPFQKTIKINLEQADINSNEFLFTLPLSELQNVMGNFKDKWYFGAYSYLKDQNGVIKPTQEQAGDGYPENPAVFDATFFSSTEIQQRMLGNYSSDIQIGGPTIVKIGTNERGFLGITPTEIDSNLGTAPELKLFTDGGNLFRDTVTIHGYANLDAGSSIELHVNDSTIQVTTDANKNFSATISLKEGENNIYASATYSTNKIIRSSSIVFNHIVFHTPIARIKTSISGNTVTLNADSSYDPNGTLLTYSWAQDATNPAKISFSTSSSSLTTFDAPSIKGEYYFTLKAANAKGDTGWARVVVLITDTGAISPDLKTWHPAWIDSSIIYSIFVRTFSASGTFQAVTAQIPELKDLGINCIWFLPIYPTTGSLGPDNPGYAITDYYGILSNYGTKQDFKTLVETAHNYGIKVILDHVINHTSALHPFMLDANKYKENSPYYDFYMWDNNDNFKYLFTWVDLPSINYQSLNTREYLLRMAKYWMQYFNIDGYRCDVAWGVNSLRTNGVGSIYWQTWRKELKEMKPDIFLLGEADADSTQYFNGKFDAAYDYTFFTNLKAVFNSSGSINQLDASIQHYLQSSYPKDARPFRYLETQDEPRFIQQFGVGDTKVAADLLLTLPGVPELYAGQEVGETSQRGNIDWSDPSKLYSLYKNLIQIRKENPALTIGNFTRLNNSQSDKIYSYLRTSGENNIIVNLNFSSSPLTAEISVPLNKLTFDSTSSFYLNDLLNKASYKISGTDLKNYSVTIPASGAQILVLSDTTITDARETKEVLPVTYNIEQNYPNPFNPSTTIKYSLPNESKVKITVFNILGQRVSQLINDVQNAGYHEIVWSAHNFASGVYLYSIEAVSSNGKSNFTAVKKMILLK